MIQNVKINNDPQTQQKLLKYMNKMIGNEFTKMMEPCYQPKFTKYYPDIVFMTGCTPDVSKNFLDDFTLAYIRKFPILTDKITMALLLPCLYYGYKKNESLSKLFFYALAVKMYGNVTFRYLKKFCNPEYWDLAMEQLSKKHLLSIKGGISSMVSYLSDAVYNSYEGKIKHGSMGEMDIMKIVYILRSRINQSFKSFMASYYKVSTSYVKMRSKSEVLEPKDAESRKKDVEQGDESTIPDKLSTSICTYSQIDQDAAYESIKLARINKQIADKLLTEVSKIENKQDINFIYILFMKKYKSSDFCSKIKRTYIAKGVASNSIKYGKYSLKSSIENFVKTIIKKNPQLKDVSKNSMSMFMTLYLINYAKNRIC